MSIAKVRDGAQPVLVISDRCDGDPIGILPCPVPLRYALPHRFCPEEYQQAPLIVLDDPSYADFVLRRMPLRPGLIIVLADPDDASVYPRAAAIGAEAVLRTGGDVSWLRLRLHEATGCQYVPWGALLTGSRNAPPP
ncbi:hypothetical protein [Streptomyces spectabilis]|uniref:Rv3660c-like CheY-like N-terminal domain-containing protein n=1 Tax=Streptomyces spectabilis TaxID=68270 RepID=A0A7W8B2T3_STRST|nr:hypothetical protein [Streptomyces spectabilis]MBB5109314.1 hypothetical protein [Streptomyces spectabilis]GGV52379.1 hypothetical protein GCM10010245_82430 [Streptomyces spectabilis]